MVSARSDQSFRLAQIQFLARSQACPNPGRRARVGTGSWGASHARRSRPVPAARPISNSRECSHTRSSGAHGEPASLPSKLTWVHRHSHPGPTTCLTHLSPTILTWVRQHSSNPRASSTPGHSNELCRRFDRFIETSASRSSPARNPSPYEWGPEPAGRRGRPLARREHRGKDRDGVRVGGSLAAQRFARRRGPLPRASRASPQPPAPQAES
jgi:hypothetical protein